MPPVTQAVRRKMAIEFNDKPEDGFYELQRASERFIECPLFLLAPGETASWGNGSKCFGIFDRNERREYGQDKSIY
jgi:hypothetical protein